MGIRALIPVLLILLPACGGDEPRADVQVQTAPNAVLASHPQYITPGPPRGPVDTIANPFAGDARAIALGRLLYRQYNCVSCHGSEGAGGIGPTLNDPRWKYGGSPAEIFQSIYEGRPEGMPVWGGRITDDHIWQLAAYLESLAGPDMSTITWPGIPAEAARATPVR